MSDEKKPAATSENGGAISEAIKVNFDREHKSLVSAIDGEIQVIRQIRDQIVDLQEQIAEAQARIKEYASKKPVTVKELMS